MFIPDESDSVLPQELQIKQKMLNNFLSIAEYGFGAKYSPLDIYIYTLGLWLPICD